MILIERLRLWGNGEHRPKPLWGEVNWPALMKEAAARIEELEAERDALKAEMELLKRAFRESSETKTNEPVTLDPDPWRQ